MYYFFLNICIYSIKKNTGDLQCCLDWVTSIEGFQASPKGFDIVLSPQIVFCTMILYDIYIYYTYMYVFLHHYVFDLSVLQTRNFYSLFCLLTKYVVYSLLSFLSLFRLGVATTLIPPYCGETLNLNLGCRWFSFQLIHQTEFINLLALYVILFGFVIIHMYYLF